MKKIFSIFMILLMAFALIGCGSEEPEVISTEEDSDEYAVNVDAISAFTSYDLDGNQVDESVFANADITVVNLWGTFCPPCIDEMPELAKWDNELPGKVQIIGIVIDVYSTDSEEFETAKMIVDDAGVGYTNIIVGDQFGDMMQNISAVPTTLFVNSEGKVIHDAFVGASVPSYQKIVEELLEG